MKQLQLWFVDADALYKTCDVDSTGYGHTIIALKIETISQLMSWPSMIIRWPPCTSSVVNPYAINQPHDLPRIGGTSTISN
jgi:hypothetical protein